MEIETGQDYLLDGKIKVTVLKALNRSKTFYSIEIPEKGIESVEKDRLKSIEDLNNPVQFFYPK
jgi:hypothetical protein